MDIDRLTKAAAEIRKLTIRAMAAAGYGHIGGASLSKCWRCCTTFIDPKIPGWRTGLGGALEATAAPPSRSPLAYKGISDTEL